MWGVVSAVGVLGRTAPLDVEGALAGVALPRR